VLEWLQKHNVEVLNVAGRATLNSKAQKDAKAFLLELFKRASAAR
jgi:hypothetical protein